MTEDSLEHHILKQDPDAAARRLGIALSEEESVLSEEASEGASDHERPARRRVAVARLPRPCAVRARFSHESVRSWLRKLFSEEIEVGRSHFDDYIFIETCTREATTALVEVPRAQAALILLVLPTRYVEVLEDVVRVIDEDPQEGPDRDALAELVALAALAIPAK